MLSSDNVELERILDKVKSGKSMCRKDNLFLLELDNEKHIEKLFETARELRSQYFGNKIFLYGFVYFSTWCRNNCAFCYFRRTNKIKQRYRKSHEETVAIACELAKSGIHLVDLTMGEDPYYHHDENGAVRLASLVKEVKEKTGLPVMISPGVANHNMFSKLAEAGTDWFACYQETHNRNLFARLRLNQSYDQRLNSKHIAREMGLLIEEGLMTGIGETALDIAISLENMDELRAHQVRVMSFIPQEGTNMSSWPSPPRSRELITIAVLRLNFPDRLIPGSLDVDGLAGLKDRLLAGANVITSLIPPSIGLAGVAQNEMDIDEGLRSVREVMPVLAEMSLQAAEPEEYRCWVEREKEMLNYKQKQ